MEASVVARVESAGESDGRGLPGPDRSVPEALVELRMLGPLTIRRAGSVVALPPSRKLRALIAYLALAPQAVMRAHLCELLWDVPNDPRGELRWCLSKARSLLDEPGRRRIETAQDTVRLALGDCHVDVIEIGRAMQHGIDTLDAQRLRALSTLFTGDFLEGLEIDRNPFFNNWLTAQRRRLRACQVAVLEHLAARLAAGSAESFACLDQWLQLAPFDRRAHELMLDSLAHRGQWREGQEHLAAAVRAFEAEGLDWRPLREAWRDAKARRATGPAGAETSAKEAAPRPGPPDGALERSGRASIAVMPFVDEAAQRGVRGGLADGLAYDIITRLAKLRSLFVIAQGTVFALDQRSVGPEEAGRTLNVDYVVSGTLLRQDKRLAVSVELVESRTARIVWADVFDHKLDDAFLALDEIGNRIVASIESEVEAAECKLAILRPPNSLDAWQAHHRGLWHMYRFNREDNERARHFFEMAVRLDPTFSRAYAGLSFTHWQNAFQRWGEREPAIERAHEAAGQGLAADDRDPAAHWAMGRALWLRGRLDQSLTELQRAVDLSPNFALAHYTLGFVNCQSGDAEAAIGSSDHSRRLSPFDPLLFGMLAVRAIALVRLGRLEEAADWAVQAAARVNAHVHILAIAACCLAMIGRVEEASVLLASIRKTAPSYRIEDFLAAFHLSPEAEALFRDGARRIGLG
ncbi:transcriptional regulator [Achromobacter sp. RTa]|uniref:tetratricopeptide repeat protein n=1 Tax=Achromobacter sp. RTa TaxID=1532557 RepID=UPI00050FC016|nr:tetratricopeptide repeat protein [Achromobacter sp. RTa]KGD87923.1 transcriptional regulator [Achromobacter sp. RTa]